MVINLRPHQQASFDSATRFEVRVWHRRAGKTFYTVAMMLKRALQATVPDWRAFYLAPTQIQTKTIT